MLTKNRRSGPNAREVYDPDRCGRYSRQFTELLINGNFDQARSIVDQAEQELTQPTDGLFSRRSLATILQEMSGKIDRTERPAGDLDTLVTNTSNAFERSKFEVIYVWELMRLDHEMAASVGNVAQKKIDYVAACLSKLGFTWPIGHLADLPVQFVIDDERALQLQRAGIMDIRGLVDKNLNQRLSAAGWRDFEIRELVSRVKENMPLVRKSIDRWKSSLNN